jgi:hypothetical protein
MITENKQKVMPNIAGAKYINIGKGFFIHKLKKISIRRILPLHLEVENSNPSINPSNY